MTSQLRILIGILFTLLTCLPIVVIAYNDLGPGFGVAPNSEKSVMEQRASSLTGKDIEVGADIFGQACATCHGFKGQGIPGRAPALNRKDLLDGTREKNVVWGGSVQAFIKDTVSSGRPIQSCTQLYSERMPTWSNEFGGPLRPDQVDAVVAFVMNWKDIAPEVDAFPAACGSLAAAGPTSTPGPSPTPAPTRAGVVAQCQNMPASFFGKKPPYNFDDSKVIAAGKTLFDANCSVCHGTQGRGDGISAAALPTKPASFQDRTFMQGVPVDCHFWRISEGGGPGSPMPAWRALGEDSIWKLLIYERSFSGIR